MKYEIVPLISVGPLKFGALIEEVELILGSATHVSKAPFNLGTCRDYGSISLGFDNDNKLIHAGFGTDFEGTLEYSGIDLFQDADALRKLIELDRSPKLWVGSVMLMKLGMQLGGYHTTADEGKTVSLFPAGRYDDKVSRFKELL
jgi:hypothetical protein